MAMNYQLESSHIADYELYTLPGVDFPLRGPYPALEAHTPLLTFLGAAQVFGTFCRYPFPNLLGEMCGARTLNLAAGGAGPGFYTERPVVLDHVNRSTVAIVQVMSARSSVRNRYMTAINARASVELRLPGRAPERLLGHHAFERLAAELDPDAFAVAIEETLENFVAQYAALAEAIRIPKILLFVGRNPPLAADRPARVGTHPHLVSEAVLARLAPLFDDLVMVTGAEGFDTRLMNRFTGEYTSIKRSETFTLSTHSAYIPPVMHVRTAQALYEPVMRHLG